MREEALACVRGWIAQGAAGMELSGPSIGFRVREPRPYMQRRGGVLSHESISRLSHCVMPQFVELGGLVATQRGVNMLDLELYLTDPTAKLRKGVIGKTGALLTHPIVIRYTGTNFIHDGHHRLSAERMAGESIANVRLIDTDAMIMDAWARFREARSLPEDGVDSYVRRLRR